MFDDDFRVCFADTPFGVALHQRIRYQVFCLDRGFEDPNTFSTAQETDAWDDHSAHFIVQNKHTGQWVAATRLVLPKRGRPLPVDSLDVFHRHRLDKPDLPVGEVSRFCIIGGKGHAGIDDRHQIEPNSLEAWGIGAIEKRQQFEITLGMIRSLIVFALKHDVVHCVMLITDAFARLLRKLGVSLRQVGPVTEHRGMRTTYMVNMRETAISMAQKSSKVRGLFKRSRKAYVRISSVSIEDTFESITEFAPDHTLFDETVFRETILLPAEKDSDLGPPQAVNHPSPAPKS